MCWNEKESFPHTPYPMACVSRGASHTFSTLRLCCLQLEIRMLTLLNERGWWTCVALVRRGRSQKTVYTLTCVSIGRNLMFSVQNVRHLFFLLLSNRLFCFAWDSPSFSTENPSTWGNSLESSKPDGRST